MRAVDQVGQWLGIACLQDSVVEPSILSMWSELERDSMAVMGYSGVDRVVRAWHVFLARCASWL
eukprot:6880855-Alexandrium_andersonii.AAC.1